jgi:hypothetical protein
MTGRATIYAEAMNVPAGEDHGAAAPAPVQLARLFPAGEPGTVAEIVEDLGLLIMLSIRRRRARA